MKKKLGFISTILVLTMACNFITKAQALPTPALEDLPTETAEAPGATGTPEGAPAPVEDTACVPSSEVTLQPAATFRDRAQGILDFLNGGGSTVALAEALRKSGAASEPIPVASADMTGSGKMDVAVALVDAGSQKTPAAGDLLIYTCQEGRYSLAYHQPSAGQQGAPRIWVLRDLDLDGGADLLAGYPTCGPSGCGEQIQALAWNGAGFENRLVGDTTGLIDPEVTVAVSSGGGIYDILVKGKASSSSGAGPARSTLRIFSLDRGSQNWVRSGEQKGEGDYRIFLVYQGDQAAKDGDYAAALDAYKQVIDNPNLQGWMDPASEHASLGAYARFKMMAIYLMQGEIGAVKSVQEDLINGASSGDPGYVFVEMAAIFRNAFPNGGAGAGCQAVRDYVKANSESVLPLFDYGSENPQYTAEDICPWEK